MKQPHDPLSEKISKTQQKKNMLALQKLGEALLKLSPSQLALIPIPDELMEAIKVAHAIKPREALRRQLQYIGKIMREIDCTPIQSALEKLDNASLQNKQHFHHLEKLREDLISGYPAALEVFLTEYPQADRQKLRQLIMNTLHERKNGKNAGSANKLFIYLREICQR